MEDKTIKQLLIELIEEQRITNSLLKKSIDGEKIIMEIGKPNFDIETDRNIEYDTYPKRGNFL
jgi:hydroxypyruvate isomerase